MDELFLQSVFSVDAQLPLIAFSFVIGVVSVFCIDVFSAVAVVFASNKAISFFFDLIIVVVSYLFIFVSALNYNNGIIRWYDMVACFAGMNIYYLLIAKPVGVVLNCAARVIGACFDHGERFVIGFLSRIFRICGVACEYIRSNFSVMYKQFYFRHYIVKYKRFAKRGFLFFDK